MSETIKYPAPMDREAQKEAPEKQETKQASKGTKRKSVQVKKKRRKGAKAVSDKWRRSFYEYPQQIARVRMQEEVKEGIAFAKESVTYRMPMPVLRVKKLVQGDTYPLCPRCNSWIEREYTHYCICCGQRLDWSMIEYARTCYS